MSKILIVDPSLLDRKRMRAILEAAGHTVAEMSSPRQVMEELAEVAPGSIQLIVTELQFPDVPGLELVRWVKRQRGLSQVPVLAVTEQPSRETLVLLVTAGASTIVTKPFGADMLLRRATETLAEQPALRQGDENTLTWPVHDYLRRELRRAQRNGSSFSVVVCRLVEGLQGQALPHLMGGLHRLMRMSDTMAKIGDDRVALLLPETDWEGAVVVETRVRELVDSLREGSSGRLVVPLQVVTGTATFPSEAADGEGLLDLASDRCG